MQVQTSAGTVSGTDRDVAEFLGIPYATAARFQPPERATWEGVLDATAFGPSAPQTQGESWVRPGIVESEDCLRLNVWTPSTEGRRPVMVWIHGGGYRQGSGSGLLYEGQRLATGGDVVVVSVNYRLGALGFLSHPDLRRTDGTSGNWGLLDQIAALEWVQREIAGFGGDPDNVTIFGESAGGGSVTWLMASPLARGLFHKVACQSGPPPVPIPQRVATRAAEQLAEHLGTDVGGIADATVEELLAGQLTVESSSPTGMIFLPTAEEPIVNRLPIDIFRSGDAAPVPLLIGTNTDEWRLWAPGDRYSRELPDEVLHKRVAKLLEDPGAADEVIDTYRRERAARGDGDANNEVWYGIKTDDFFRAPIRETAGAHAAHHPTFVYLFDWKSPALGGFMGACHGLEIPFVFGNHGRSGIARWTGAGDENGPAANALSEQMMAAWVAFARTGDPSTAELAWPVYDVDAKPTMWLGPECGVEKAPLEAEVAALEAHRKG